MVRFVKELSDDPVSFAGKILPPKRGGDGKVPIILLGCNFSEIFVKEIMLTFMFLTLLSLRI